MEVMPRPRLPHLQRERTRHGKMVWYVRVRRGARVRLMAEYGSPEFMAEYHAAVAGSPAKASYKIRTGSLEWLVRQWQQSSDWHLKAEATKTQRTNILDHLLEDNGPLPFTDVDAKAILEGRERRMKTPAAANNFLKVMRALFAWAEDSGFIEESPAAGVKFLPHRGEGHPPWTEADLTVYRARWPMGTRERLAMELLLWTGLRRGDAVRLGKQHVRDGVAFLKAEKTGADLAIPIVPPLTEAIVAGPTGDLVFIAGVRGGPMSKESFGTWFREACDAAGVKASAHGLRKLSATMAAENGASELQLQAFYGWRSNAQSSLYTRKANAGRLAKQAGNILFPHPETGKGKRQ